MKDLRIALIYGGRGREHDVSRMGAKNLLSILEKEGLTVYPVYIDRHGGWHGAELCPSRRGLYCESEGARIGADVAFPLLHGDFGEDGRVQGALECAGVPYVGCGIAAGAVAADKHLTKAIAEAEGIPTLPWVLLTPGDAARARADCESRLGYPMFIKPTGLGSSVGCSAVPSSDGFNEGYAMATESGRALAEKYLEGARELECAYSCTARFGEIFAPPGEVVSRGVYTYDEKYGNQSRAALLPRAELPSGISELAMEYSRRMVRSLGIRQLARIDFFLKDGELLLNEINTMPGFTAGSLYAAMLSEYKISTGELLRAMIEDAYDRRF